MDELKACVASDDIEGIVCLTAAVHIILVINAGWLHSPPSSGRWLVYLTGAVMGCWGSAPALGYSWPAHMSPSLSTPCLLMCWTQCCPLGFLSLTHPASVFVSACSLFSGGGPIHFHLLPLDPFKYSSLCLSIEFLLI